MADPANPELEPAELRAEVVDLRRHGKTFPEIGQLLGFSKQRACALYWEAMHSVVDHAVTAHRAAMVEEALEVIRVANDVMHTDHIAHSNGKVVLHPVTGEPLIDSAPKLDAGRTIIAAHARLSRLVGADAATKVETDLNILKYEVVGIQPSDLV